MQSLLQWTGPRSEAVTCLTADICTCLTADPGVVSLNQARSHNFTEFKIMKQFLRPFSSLPLNQEGLLSVASESMCTKYWLTA